VIIDTSALVAIMFNESSAPRLIAAIDGSSTRLISAGTILEAALVLLGRFGERGEVQLDALIRSLNAEVVAFDSEQLTIARDGARTFGRGRHRAALNFGDCFGYALAVSRGEPLLFVGDDFAQTDVVPAAW
jgi:ribonuclease VapC